MNEALTQLDEAACRELLGEVQVGRVAWADGTGRAALLPVNFVLDGDAVVFRTAEGAKLEAVRAGRPLTFEADDLEPALRTARSVVVTGPAEIVTDPAEIRRLGGLPLTPWDRSAKPFLVRLTIQEVTGRRIPVHRGGVARERI
ncbi:pyridoxamine 5'-phosphate oxidase family protein [Actinomadura roseirufa]|uniref:pyridoxamine 5'-phosphate oxidase family protein n=1 Tax=Actinomadura roseirufa TaxID=2094049 RepID=UPI001041A4F4|nr:pyridoxamine 5'-phosphate oxidase family protein [Actinomadura roseirufa]